MIIDILRDQSNETKDRVTRLLFKKYVKKYHHTPPGYGDLYSIFPRAPYRGNSSNTYCRATLDDAEHNCENDYHDCDIVDEDYLNWFDALITPDEEAELAEWETKDRLLRESFTKKRTDYSISFSDIDESTAMVKWIAKNSDIKWAFIRSIGYCYDYLLFDNHNDYMRCLIECCPRLCYEKQMKYAVEELSWKEIENYDDKWLEWITENCWGEIRTVTVNRIRSIYLQLETDYVAWKVMFGHERS